MSQSFGAHVLSYMTSLTTARGIQQSISSSLRGKITPTLICHLTSGLRPETAILLRIQILSPFAALRGYEDEIRAEGINHLKGSRIELSDEEQGKLSEQLQKVTKGMRVVIRYFKEGFYEDIEGVVLRIDPIEQVVYLQAAEVGALEKDIPIEILFWDILQIRVTEYQE